jgi:peptidoglycan/LPS O-acetylase OafA/YrhL
MPALDGLRGVAAVSVLTFHVIHALAGNISRIGLPALATFSLTSLGANGVGLFFVLSGFLLSAPFVNWLLGDRERPDIGRYARARILRIFPAWWLALAVCIALFSHWLVRRPFELGSFFALQQNYLGLGHRVVPQGWTLVVEISFYAVAPMIALLLIRPLSGRSRPVRAGVIAAGLLGVIVASWDLQVRVLPHIRPVPDALALSLPTYADRFALGALVALATVLINSPRGGRRLLLLAVGVAGLGLGHYTEYRYQFCTVGFALIVYSMVAAPQSRVARLFALPAPRVLGRLSYGIYLWHLPLLYMAISSGLVDRGHAIQIPLVLAGLLAASVAVAELSYRLVERPALALVDAKARPAPALSVRRLAA